MAIPSRAQCGRGCRPPNRRSGGRRVRVVRFVIFIPVTGRLRRSWVFLPRRDLSARACVRPSGGASPMRRGPTPGSPSGERRVWVPLHWEDHGAERMHLAVAAASSRIRNMEAALGRPLLHREHRGVQPTPAGRSLVHHARILLQQADRMHGELARFSAFFPKRPNGSDAASSCVSSCAALMPFADWSSAVSGSASSLRPPPSVMPKPWRSAGSS